MSVYNGEEFVSKAMESILSQTFEDFELIVVDDGSRDGTAKALDEYRDDRIVRIDHEQNQGLAASLNHGLRKARGEFIARQDADDISMPNRLQEEVALLSRETGTVIVGSTCEEIDEFGNVVRMWRYPLNDIDIRWHTLFHCSFVHSSVMFRASVLQANALSYDENEVYAQDYELWSRFLAYGSAFNIREPLVRYRTHCRQISQRSLGAQSESRDRISRTNLEKRGMAEGVSDEDLGVLRKWVMRGPRLTDAREMRLARLLLRILVQFSRCSDVDPIAAKELRRAWVERLLDAASARQTPALVTSGLLSDVLWRDCVSVLAHGSTRAARRVRRTFSRRRGLADN